MFDLALVQITTAALLITVAATRVWRRPDTALSWTWIAFCVSASASLSLRVLGPDSGNLASVLLAPASATCGASWLLARALFRSSRPISIVHIAVVLVIAAVNLAPAGLFEEVLGNLQNLLASTVIMLTLWEAVRGWHKIRLQAERVMRSAYLSVTAAAILVAVVWLRNPTEPVWLNEMVETLALLAVTLIAALCVHFRFHNPLTSQSLDQPIKVGKDARPVSAEIIHIADKLDRMVKAETLYLDGDLKVATLARRLQVPDYKVTRAITGALNAPNFNAYINRYRIDHARDLLATDPCRSILAVAFDSGFASIGPFNRAFKSMTGQTPRDYRAGLNTEGLAELA